MTKKRFGKREGFFSQIFFEAKNTYKIPLPHYYCVVVLLLLLLRAFERAFIGAFLLSPLRREENGEVSGDDEETTE